MKFTKIGSYHSYTCMAVSYIMDMGALAVYSDIDNSYISDLEIIVFNLRKKE